MDILNQVLSLENAVLCLAIVALVWALRKSLELSIPALTKAQGKASEWWREFVVPLAPLVSGGLLMLIPQLPVPEMFAGSMPGRAVFGVGLGLLSGTMYRLVKQNLVKKLKERKESKNSQKDTYL